jgi:hypothetical protein
MHVKTKTLCAKSLKRPMTKASDEFAQHITQYAPSIPSSITKAKGKIAAKPQATTTDNNDEQQPA